MDSTGTVNCPTTHVMNFTHSSGNKEDETILSNDEAAAYTVANIFGSWAPDSIAAQEIVTKAILNRENGTLQIEGNADTYLVKHGDEMFFTDAALPIKMDLTEAITVRAANGRGGFGPAKEASEETALNNVKEGSTVQKFIENGQVVILRDGVKYSVLGSVIAK